MYVVTEGTYSSYGIVGVFDSKPNAEEFMSRFCQGNDWRIEEYPLNPYVIEARAGLKAFNIYMYRDGEIAGGPSDIGRIDDPECSVVPAQTMERWCFRQRRSALFIACWARDAEHMVKIANDRRAQLIALGQWPEDDA